MTLALQAVLESGFVRESRCPSEPPIRAHFTRTRMRTRCERNELTVNKYGELCDLSLIIYGYFTNKSSDKCKGTVKSAIFGQSYKFVHFR